MRRMRWILAGSLAVNLLLLGLIGGVALRGAPPFGAAGAGLGLVGYARALPAEHRRALVREMRREEWESRRAAMAGANVALREALRAEPFDAAAMRAALAEARGAQARLAERAEGLLADRIEGMDADERRAFADRLERRRER